MIYKFYETKVKPVITKIIDSFNNLSKLQRAIAIGVLILCFFLVLKSIPTKKKDFTSFNKQDYTSSYIENKNEYASISSDMEMSSDIDTSSDDDTVEDEQSIYDDLQTIFSQLTYDTTQKDIKKQIKKYKLKYSKENYNGNPESTIYILAYNSDVAAQRYADSGDNLEIAFNQNDGSFMYAAYENHFSSKIGLLYNYGTYWSFRFNEPNNNYSGYYYYIPGGRNNGIVLQYSNGNTAETPYHPCANAKVVLMNCMYK